MTITKYARLAFIFVEVVIQPIADKRFLIIHCNSDSINIDTSIPGDYSIQLSVLIIFGCLINWIVGFVCTIQGIVDLKILRLDLKIPVAESHFKSVILGCCYDLTSICMNAIYFIIVFPSIYLGYVYEFPILPYFKITVDHGNLPIAFGVMKFIFGVELGDYIGNF